MNTHTDQLISEANPPNSSDAKIRLPRTNNGVSTSIPRVGEFLSTCALVHAFRVTSQIESIPAPEHFSTRIPETGNIEEKPMWTLKGNSYIYKPLPIESRQRVIRLMAILPSERKTADIKCILGPENLNRNPSYEALSYVWGDATKLKRIDVCKHAFYVTENLEIALRNLRLRNKLRVLWVDAICINQNDVVEKSSQIRQMGEIYSQATEVLIWLGPETLSSAKAFCFLRSIIHPPIKQSFEQSVAEIQSEDWQPIISSRYSNQLRFPALYDQESYDQNRQKWLQFTVQEDPNSVQYLQALCELLRRPWWKRIWVVQELVRSRRAKLVCGTQTFPWTEFYHAMGTLVDAYPNRHTNVIRNSTIIAARDRKTAAGARIELLQDIAASFVPTMTMQYFRERWLGSSLINLPMLIFGTQRFQSTDPRDAIYGLLGLINNSQDLGDIAIPDYNISPEKLFTKVAKWLLCFRQDLVLFEELQNVNYPSPCQVDGLSLPSWVPDFRFDRSIPSFDGHFWAFVNDEDIVNRMMPWVMRLGSSNNSGGGIGFMRPFNAGLETTSLVPFRFSSDDKILTVTGVEVDSVLNVLEPCLYDVAACVNGWKQIILPNGDSAAVYKCGGTIKEAFWRTILANINLWDCDIEEIPQLVEGRIDGISEMPPRSAVDEKNIVKGMLIGARIPLPAFRRRVFQTSSGLLGLGPAIMEPGDMVTVLYGSRVPVILRPCQHSEQHRVVGQR